MRRKLVCRMLKMGEVIQEVKVDIPDGEMTDDFLRGVATTETTVNGMALEYRFHISVE